MPTNIAGLFGLVSVSSLSAYLAINKLAAKHPQQEFYTVLVDSYDDIEEADVLVFSRLDLFLHHLNYMTPQMVAVVCDGPLALAQMDNMELLDVERRVSYEYQLITPSYAKVLSQARKASSSKPPVVQVKQTSINHLKQIADTVVPDSELLVPLNRLFATCNQVARAEVKDFLCKAIYGLVDLDDFTLICSKMALHKNHRPYISDMQAAINSKHFENLAYAVHDGLDNGKPNSKLSREYGVSEFELRYIKAMIREYVTDKQVKEMPF